MSADKVTPISPIVKSEDIVAACPSCGAQEWYLRLDGFNQDWSNLTGTQCVGCGHIIDWVRVEKSL